MPPRTLSIAVAALALVVLLVVGLLQLSGSSATPTTGPLKLSLVQERARLAGSPPALASLHAQANEILPGGLPALRARLSALRGQPIVINKWASWCQPCRAEFGIFQRVSLARGREVAFLGIDSSDSRSKAGAFLREYPLSYPSYFDPSGQLGEAITDSGFTPVTVFYNRKGRLFIYQGPFASTQKLERDINHYALEG
jgi:cytochrome c biogenesis protein CcmG, thiol:disulfide interchange protein DsbE